MQLLAIDTELSIKQAIYISNIQYETNRNKEIYPTKHPHNRNGSFSAFRTDRMIFV